MNRLCSPSSVFLLVLLLTPPASGTEPTKKEAELKWAKGVATDFFEAAFKGKLEQAECLIDSSMKNAFAKEGDKRLREWLNNSIYIHMFNTPVFLSEEIAPDNDEASFKGTFKDKEHTFQFVLRVVKDRDTSKWRVCYFQFTEQEKKTENKNR